MSLAVCVCFSLCYLDFCTITQRVMERDFVEISEKLQNGSRIRVFDIFWSSGSMSDPGMFQFKPYNQPYMGKMLVVY